MKTLTEIHICEYRHMHQRRRCGQRQRHRCGTGKGESENNQIRRSCYNETCTRHDNHIVVESTMLISNKTLFIQTMA